ncbi:MAG: DUF3108 domain-containing protein [Magnetococcales bacterium]|nr:DUF3108 domain-containing protein [Magnetococcales bacterium]
MRHFFLSTRPALLSISFLSLFLTTVPLLASTEEQTPVFGGVPGEVLIYNVHWVGIPAGRAEIKMGQAEPNQYKLEAMVETIGMVKFLHAIKDTLNSSGDRLDDGTFHSSTYFKDQRKGSNIRQTTYEFDREKNVVQRLRKKEKPIHITISKGEVNDPLAVFFTLRSLPKLEPNTSLSWVTVDGRKEYEMTVEIGQPTQEFTPLGRFDIIPIKVKIPSSKELFRQEEAIEIWLTNDHRRMPVRVETRLSLGGVAADLVSFKDGRGGQDDIGGNP